MKILIIGNGFDLAHGLPTTYVDFLEFYKRINIIYFNISKSSRWEVFKEEHLDNWDINQEIKDAILDAYKNRKNNRSKDAEGKWIGKITTPNPFLDEFYDLCKDNLWFEYFCQCDMHGKENWIDFESEISDVIQLLDRDMQDLSEDGYIYDKINNLSNSFFKGKVPLNLVTFKELRDILINNLDRLIRAFEIYLCEYVETKDVIQLELIKNLHPDHVLSFNYTNTYEKHYGNGKKIEYDYIHGKADIKNNEDTSNMVLGIDEYLSDDRVNKDVEFIAFKKFYQRIHKETGCIYKEWVDEIRDSITESEEKLKSKFPTQIPFERFITKHYLYIFGHSLDVTDKDVLRDLILNDNVFTTIYYYNKEVYGQQIANLVKVIGKDELIRRTSGKTKTIEFVDQQKSEKEEI